MSAFVSVGYQFQYTTLNDNSYITYPRGCTCKAYRKDHRRCNKTASNNGLCDIHQSYYRDWFASRPPLYGHNRYKVNRLYQSYKEQLESGRVLITSANLNSLGDDANHSDYYLLLCATCKHVNPLWNMELFARTIETDLQHWIRFPSYEHQFLQTFKILSKAPGATIYAGYCIIRFCMYQLMDYYTYHEQDIQDRLEIICDSIFEQDVWRSTLYSSHWTEFYENMDTFLEKHMKENIYSAEEIALESRFYRLAVSTAIQSTMETHQACVRSRLAVYKEELMAAVWHPRRVERWVQHYGLDNVFDHI